MHFRLHAVVIKQQSRRVVIIKIYVYSNDYYFTGNEKVIITLLKYCNHYLSTVNFITDSIALSGVTCHVFTRMTFYL